MVIHRIRVDAVELTEAKLHRTNLFTIMKHNRKFTEGFPGSDRDIYDVLGNAMERYPMFVLPRGKTPFQGKLNTCAAEMVLNLAEDGRRKFGSDWFPSMDAAELYPAAREVVGVKKWKKGVSAEGAAEAYCQLVGTGVKWMNLPLDPQLFAAWIKIEETGVGLGMYWPEQWNNPGGSRVLRSAPGTMALEAHAIRIAGWELEHQSKKYPWSKPTVSPVLWFENSADKHPELPARMLPGLVNKYGLSAVVLIPPGYGSAR